jgi:hypothetical protein
MSGDHIRAWGNGNRLIRELTVSIIGDGGRPRPHGGQSPQVGQRRPRVENGVAAMRLDTETQDFSFQNFFLCQENFREVCCTPTPLSGTGLWNCGVNSWPAARVDDVVAAINALALMLTGERDYFSLRAHSIGAAKPE